MMICKSKFAVVAGVGMLGGSALATLPAHPAQDEAWAKMQSAQSWEAGDLTCASVVRIASRDDDWTAWGGAMRGLEK